MTNETTDSGNRRTAIIALIVVNAMWGSSFPLMKALNLEIDQQFGVDATTASTWLRTASAAWMIGIRFAIALVLFLIFFRHILRRTGRLHLRIGAVIGTLFFAGLLLQVMGLGTIPASRSGFLTSLAVVFTPILSSLYQKKRPRLVVLCGAGLAMLGISILTGLIVWQDGSVRIAQDAIQRWTIGDTLTTVAAVFFSLQIMTVDVYGKKYDSTAFTPSMFATTAALSLLAFAALKSQVPETAAEGWVALTLQPRFFVLTGLLCVFPSLLAFAWMNKYQPHVSAEQAAVVYTLEPVFASTWAMFLPAMLSVWCGIVYVNETFTWPMVIGGALVLLANVLALWPEKSEPSPD